MRFPWEQACFSAGIPKRSKRPFALRPLICQAKPPVVDAYTTSVQWSRRLIGLKLFLSIAHHGEGGYARMIEHQTDMGGLLRESLRRAGWRILNRTPLPLC